MKNSWAEIKEEEEEEETTKKQKLSTFVTLFVIRV